MKTVLIFLAMSCVCTGTTLTGTLNNPNATGANGTLIMALSQQTALLSGCGGPAEITPGYLVRFPIVSGSISGSSTIYGNDCMLPANTYYKVEFTDPQGNVLFSDNWVITGGTMNIGTIVSASLSGTTTTLGSAGFVVLAPAGGQTVNQPVSTNLSVNLFQVTGTLTFPDGSTCTTGGCNVAGNAVILTGTQTVSGVKTFSNGLVATVYNSTADVAGGNAFQTSMGNMHITGTGIGYFQGLNSNGLGIAAANDATEAVNVNPGFVFASGGFATTSTSIAAINANAGTIQGKYITAINSLLFGGTTTPPAAVAGQAEVYMNTSFQLMACVNACPGGPVNLLAGGGGGGSGTGSGPNPIFNTIAVGTGTGQMTVAANGAIVSNSTIQSAGVMNSTGGFMTNTGSFYVCSGAGTPVGACTVGGNVGTNDLNVGGHNGSNIATSGNGAQINNVTNNIAMYTYDTGGACGIGTGEASPGIACSSDERLKSNILGMDSAMDKMMKLRPVSYNWKYSGAAGIGFIAQEVQKVLPNLVMEKDGMLMLSEEGMIPYLVKALQEQQKEIDLLKWKAH